MEGRESFDLASRDARLPFRPTPHRVLDLQATGHELRTDVAPRRSSQRAIQLLPRRLGHVRSGDALSYLGFGQFRSLWRKSNVATPLMVCGPSNHSISARSWIPSL